MGGEMNQLLYRSLRLLSGIQTRYEVQSMKMVSVLFEQEALLQTGIFYIAESKDSLLRVWSKSLKAEHVVLAIYLWVSGKQRFLTAKSGI